MTVGGAKKIKVLGFDSWRVGAHHYERLVAAFAARGIGIELVHLGSWGNDPGRSPEELVGGLKVRDIAYYRHGDLRRVLEEEAPDAVVFLSTMTFAHRALLRYCRQRGIPTLNLYHGLTSTWFDVEARTGIQTNLLGHLRFVLKKLYKTFRYTIPCYLLALWRTGASAEDWWRFLEDLFAMFTGRHIGVASNDSRTTACAVYTEVEVDHALFTYGFERSQIHVVGNPDLVRFGVTPGLVGCCLAVQRQPEPRVMYIDTGLAPAGLIFSGEAQFIEHLRATAAALTAQGRTMQLKLHPADNVQRIRDRLVGTGVVLVADDEFMPRLLECEACIVETTSLAMVPALLGMPLFFAQFGDLRELTYGSGLTSYPLSTLLRDIRQYTTQLVELKAASNTQAISHWIRSNAGPLPAWDMPDRVAACVLSMMPATKSTDGPVDQRRY